MHSAYIAIPNSEPHTFKNFTSKTYSVNMQQKSQTLTELRFNPLGYADLIL